MYVCVMYVCVRACVCVFVCKEVSSLSYLM
jgi:hypothetical protein